MELDKEETIKVLNEIVELPLAGAVRYPRHSVMVLGHRRGVDVDRRLLSVTEGSSVSLELSAREMVRNQELHITPDPAMSRILGDA